MRILYEEKKIIVIHDKLDFVKGILQKLCFLVSKRKDPSIFLKKNFNAWFASYALFEKLIEVIMNELRTTSLWSKWLALHGFSPAWTVEEDSE